MRDQQAEPENVRRTAAVAEVDGYFAGMPDASRLPASALEQYHDRGYRLGWRVPVTFSDGSRRELYVLADRDYPYTLPRIAVAGGPDVLAWPHLENDGFLCILSSDAAVSATHPTEVTTYLLGEACRLIEDGISRRNTEDFRDEFLSYWSLAAGESAPSCISLLEPQGPSRRISVWRGKRIRVLGEGPESLKRWLSRWGAKKGKDGDYRLYDGVLIWLSAPLLPADYPRTAADVRNLAHVLSPDSAGLLEELVAAEVDEIDVVLGAQTPHGACYAAANIRPPRRIGAPKRRADPLLKGFRPGRVPPALIASRYLSGATKVNKATVERADHLWIHGRDQDSQQEQLRQLRVAILGCGSVGGPLARLLAQGGIGNLLLVDPSTMDWPNVGRHELGARSVSRFKAVELAEKIEQTYPHLNNVAWRRERVGPEAQQLMNELADYDLIVSTMGNWAGEGFLNDWQRQRVDCPPILYGWVEPHAVAAHAVVIRANSACLRCGTNDKGRPHLPVTDWPQGGDSHQAPACGALFTPFGPTELCWAHALLSEAVIDALSGGLVSAPHRIWIGRRDRVEAAGGRWSARWIEEMGDPGAGGIVAERPWRAAASCPACTRRERAA